MILLCAVVVLGIVAIPAGSGSDTTVVTPPPSGIVQQKSLLAPPQPKAAVNCAEVACLALTFDDGPDPVNTPRLLDLLRDRQVRATFFVVGANAAAHPDIVRRMYSEGHEVGNHSWVHPNLTKLDPAQIDDQVVRTQFAVMAAGVPAPRWFRPPYGAMNDQVRAHVPMALALWNIDPEDWGAKDPGQVVERILARAGPGRVVDLHDMHRLTVDAMPAVIDALKPHYTLVTMSELFDTEPGQRGEFYGR